MIAVSTLLLQNSQIFVKEYEANMETALGGLKKKKNGKNISVGTNPRESRNRFLFLLRSLKNNQHVDTFIWYISSIL